MQILKTAHNNLILMDEWLSIFSIRLATFLAGYTEIIIIIRLRLAEQQSIIMNTTATACLKKKLLL